MQDNKDGARRWSPRDFARMIGVSTRTLSRWDSSGSLKAARLPSGRKFYTAEHYAACGGDASAFDPERSDGHGQE